MKSKTHPKYFDKAEIKCSCGNVIKTGSTVERMSVEICSACHPFYTGKKKLIDSAGQVDRFQKRLEKFKEMKATAKTKKKTSSAEKKAGKKTTKPKKTIIKK